MAPIPATPSGDLLAPGAAPAVSSASPIPSPAIALRPLGSPGNQPDPSPTAASLRASRPAAQEVRPRAAFGPGPDGQGGCTVAQLRRFIKSRAYVPLHELRRRFDLPGGEDDVSPVIVQGRRLYVGLRPREADLLGELLGAGDVGYELLLDPSSPLIVGVFPMRPVPRS